MGQGDHTDAQVDSMATKYVQARVVGTSPREAARTAGYSDKTKIPDLERPGGPVDRKFEEMRLSLKAKGIDDDWLAEQYDKGVKKAMAGDEFEAMAHAKYLLQIGYLLGHGSRNNGTTVAVQVNNSPQFGAPGDDPARARELVGEVTELIAILKAELGERKPAGVHDGDIGAADTALSSHPGVDSLESNGGEPASGGGA